MRVRCIAERPSKSQLLQLGRHHVPNRTVYPVRRDAEYVVFGICFWDGIVWIDVEVQTEVLVSVPLFLFEIVDGRPSRLWETRLHESGRVTMWPPSFYDGAYHDRLSDGKLPETKDFELIKKRMEIEELSENL